jgi:hypothetical protein
VQFGGAPPAAQRLNRLEIQDCRFQRIARHEIWRQHAGDAEEQVQRSLLWKPGMTVGRVMLACSYRALSQLLTDVRGVPVCAFDYRMPQM